MKVVIGDQFPFNVVMANLADPAKRNLLVSFLLHPLVMTNTAMNMAIEILRFFPKKR